VIYGSQLKDFLSSLTADVFALRRYPFSYLLAASRCRHCFLTFVIMEMADFC